MSYILDALSKAEEERQRGAAPTLATQHSPLSLEPRIPGRWLYGIVGALAFVLFAAAWFLWKPQSEPAPVPTIPARPQAPAPLASTPAAPAPVAPTPAAPGPDAPPPSIASVPSSAAAVSAATAPPRAAERPKAAASTAPRPPAQGPIAATLAPSERIVNVAELPAALRQELPKIVVSGYSHSADASVRMAVINDRMFREGEEVADGLKVHQISPGGIVFSYKGYRFRSGSP